MPAISNDWLAPLSQEFCKPYYKKLYETVLAEYQRGPVFPPGGRYFQCLSSTPLSDVKVVILGQVLIITIIRRMACAFPYDRR